MLLQQIVLQRGPPPQLRHVKKSEASSQGTDYQLFLAINDIEHTKTKARHPQTNGICERFHKTILQEFYQVTFRKKIYKTIDDLQKDFDQWIDYYNIESTHRGKYATAERQCIPWRKAKPSGGKSS